MRRLGRQSSSLWSIIVKQYKNDSWKDHRISQLYKENPEARQEHLKQLLKSAAAFKDAGNEISTLLLEMGEKLAGEPFESRWLLLQSAKIGPQNPAVGRSLCNYFLSQSNDLDRTGWDVQSLTKEQVADLDY